jgi:hypothetical protein
LVAGLALAGCGRRALDPCEPRSFEAEACEGATRDGGYYYGGRWYPHTYGYPYSYYYGGYHNYTRGGGAVAAAPHSSYAHPSASGTSRGAFGGTPAGHGGGE